MKNKIDSIIKRFGDIENSISGSFSLETKRFLREISIGDFIDYLVGCKQLNKEDEYAIIRAIETKAEENCLRNRHGSW